MIQSRLSFVVLFQGRKRYASPQVVQRCRNKMSLRKEALRFNSPDRTHRLQPRRGAQRRMHAHPEKGSRNLAKEAEHLDADLTPRMQ